MRMYTADANLHCNPYFVTTDIPAKLPANGFCKRSEGLMVCGTVTQLWAAILMEALDRVDCKLLHRFASPPHPRSVPN